MIPLEVLACEDSVKGDRRTYHVATGAGSGEEHVGGNLSQDITNKEDRNTSLVL
jgi:hypothetical protein